MIRGSYRVPAPLPEERVVWPDAFGTRFLITVDVEEEFDWAAPLSRDHRATAAMAAFPEAHRRFADYGAGLMCLVDHPIATDPASVEVLARTIEDGRSEIGAQLHAWVTPPYDELLTAANSFAGNLPPALEAAKIDALTDALTTAFGTRPRVFRSGRYGLGPSTLRLLAERGYRADTSVRARYDYRGEGGPDFGAVGAAAFRREGLVELPLTTAYIGLARRWGGTLHPAAGRIRRGRGVLARTGLVSRIALTPEDMPVAEACAAASAAIADGERLLVFSFHSPTLAPGHTPYVRDATDLASFWHWWRTMFAHLHASGVEPATMEQVLAAAGG